MHDKLVEGGTHVLGNDMVADGTGQDEAFET